MFGVVALRFADLLLGGACLERIVAKLVLEDGELLVRGVAQSPQRRFLGAGVDWFGVHLQKGAQGLIAVPLGGSSLVVPFAHIVTGSVPVDSIHERVLIGLRERLNDSFERGLLLGTWLGFLSGRCVKRALRELRAIPRRLLPGFLLGLLDLSTLSKLAFTGELCHRGLLLAA